MQATSFTRNMLIMLAGPLIWAAHFLAIYVFTGIVCARPALQAEWLGMNVAGWGTLAATIAAFIAMAAILLRLHPGQTDQDNRRFIRWMSLALGLLSAIAIAWESVPVFLVPACS